MIPIVSVPPLVKGIIGRMNLSYHQRKHLGSYVTGLIAARKKTVAAMSTNFLGEISSRGMNRFLTEYKWNPSCVNTQRLKELQKHNETRWSKRGVGIIDDTLLEKTGKKIPYSGKFYDHCEEKYVWAQNIITLHYADNKTNYPVNERIYEKKGKKEFKTKIQLAMELVTEAINHDMPSLTYIFDSWYLSRVFVDFLESQGKLWIGACKSDLLVRSNNRWVNLYEWVETVTNWRGVKIRNRQLQIHEKTLLMKSLNRKVRIIVSREKDEKGEMHTLFLATKRRGNAEDVLADYMLRGKIDAFYKDAKQYLGLGDCQLRNSKGVRGHLTAVFLAHSILRLGVVQGQLSKIAATVYQSERRFLFDLLERFVYFVLEQGYRIFEVLPVLLRY